MYVKCALLDLCRLVASVLRHVTPSSPPCSSPAVKGEARGPRTATISLKPPPGGPWETYRLVLCPVGGTAGDCVSTTCTPTSLSSPSCLAVNLSPTTTYVVQASVPTRHGVVWLQRSVQAA